MDKENNLVAIIAPPSNPSELPSEGGWAAVEKRLGVSLPDDYKRFIETYGSGCIGRFLWIFNPFSKNQNLNLERQIVTQAKVLEELQTYGEVMPFKSFPEQEGILPFGITDNGDLLFWRTIGRPDDWSIVVNEARSPEWEDFNLSISEFLTEILKRQLVCNCFPKSFPSLPLSYEASA
ncbi:SMI1/KNR4 family protein [Andreprevotia chitinilytica]|uniref:SMI1/KNR4 family protein n=1 Tax=Andreprevotia chitinilytica TaxID=396808 RepID=UPI00068E9D82|nr:SMI1/KNR4 family protein [Andreprevotia chitinilytica]